MANFFWVCLRYAWSTLAAASATVATYNRLQLAAPSATRPHNANEARRRVLLSTGTWEAMSVAIANAKQGTDGTLGTWTPAAGKSFSAVLTEPPRPYQYRASVRGELKTDDTPMEQPENLSPRALHLGRPNS